eukprot:scaffold662813_cov45-Prasinocladus_malaysianus.AAC.1
MGRVVVTAHSFLDIFRSKAGAHRDSAVAFAATGGAGGGSVPVGAASVSNPETDTFTRTQSRQLSEHRPTGGNEVTAHPHCLIRSSSANGPDIARLDLPPGRIPRHIA